MDDRRSRFIGDRRGATAIEYALIAGLVALVIVSGLSVLSTSIQALYNSIAAAL